MIDHYRDLLTRQQWFADALCWTVVRPFEETTADDLLYRLNGGRDPEERVLAYPSEEAGEEFVPMLFVYECEGAYGFLEFSHGLAVPDPVLADLSRESQLWMATWHFNGGHTMLYAAGGEIRARLRNFAFQQVVEEGDPGVLAEFRAMLDGLAPDDYLGKRAAAFAFIEAATGMGLESEWLDVEDAPVVVIDGWA